MAKVHVFVDGSYLMNEVGKLDPSAPFPDLRRVIANLLSPGARKFERDPNVQGQTYPLPTLGVGRITIYDALPEDPPQMSPEAKDRWEERQRAWKRRESYWKTLEMYPDISLGWGTIKGVQRPRQKKVDTTMTTDMLSGAFNKLFDTVVLFAGDTDFVPVVQEMKRLGVQVLLAGVKGSTGEELLRAVDRSFLYDNARWSQLQSVPTT